MNRELKYLLNMLRFIFGREECPEFDEKVDFYELYKICSRHHIEPLMASGLKKCSYHSKIDDRVYKMFMDAWKLELARDLQQKIAMEKIFDLFEKNQITYVPLKGIYVKKYYPSSELRTMSDLDILYKVEQEKLVDNIFEYLGYECYEKNSHQHVFIKKPFMNVEMHVNLVDDASRFDDYYKDIFSRLVHKEGCCYEMSYNDFYIYHIVHLSKHFITSGCGLRFLIDLYVLELELSDCIDFDYVDKELIKLGLYDFKQHICMLTKKLFDGDEIKGIYLDTLMYMFFSGVYGNMLNSSINKVSLNSKNIKLGKIRLWINVIFKPLKEMRRYYTYVDKYPCLLPVGWIHRFARNVCNLNKTKNTFKSNLIDNSHVALRRDYLNKIGIYEEY